MKGIRTARLLVSRLMVYDLVKAGAVDCCAIIVGLRCSTGQVDLCRAIERVVERRRLGGGHVCLLNDFIMVW